MIFIVVIEFNDKEKFLSNVRISIIHNSLSQNISKISSKFSAINNVDSQDKL